jgi:hypothetical protein
MQLFDLACELGDREALQFLVALHRTDADLRGPLAGMLVADRRARERRAELDRERARQVS